MPKYKPDGSLVDNRACTLALRHELHLIFDSIWQSGIISRQGAYRWLIIKLNIIHEDYGHISLLNYDQLCKMLEYCREFIAEHQSTFEWYQKREKTIATTRKGYSYEKSRTSYKRPKHARLEKSKRGGEEAHR